MHIPVDILLGRFVQQTLRAQVLDQDQIQLHGAPGSPVLRPISDPSVVVSSFPVACYDDKCKLSPEVEKFKNLSPTLFDANSLRTERPDDHGVRHGIITDPNIMPINLPSGLYSAAQVSVLDEFVQSALQKGHIRPSDSPWSSPTLVVPKKDERSRVCIDYRSLNKITRRNAFPLPNANSGIQRAAGSCFYTALHLRDGFWQIKVAPHDVEKTACSTPTGH